MLKKFAYLIFLALISLPLNAQQQRPEVRGVWLSRDVVVQGRTSMREAFRELKSAGFNTVYINNWYLGSTIYPSDVLASYGGDEQLSDYHGWDPLAAALEEAHRIGIEVHVWFEYGLIGYYSYPGQQSAGPILENHPDWLMTDRNGQHYYTDGYGNYQYWMDPAHPAIVQFLKQLFVEVAEKYPALDGIQTDRIRYPGIGFSFSDTTRAAYQRETGGSDPINIAQSDAEWSDFVSWRERQTSDLADTIYQAIKRVNPEIVVSSAVAPPYMLSGDQDKLQDWPTWLTEHSVDYVCPMLYGLHPNFDYWLNQCLAVAPYPMRIFPGIDINDLDNSTISSLITKSREHQMPGVVVWYWGYLNNQNMDYLAANDFSDDVHPSTEDIVVDNTNGYNTRSQGFTNFTGGFDGHFATSSESNAWFSWDMPVYSDGNYHLLVYVPEEAIPEITQQYTVSINGDETENSLDPEVNTSGWRSVTDLDLTSSDEITVTLHSDQSGEIVADAVRLSKLQPLQIAEAFASDSQHVRMRFNQAVTGTEVTDPAHYSIDRDVTIQSVQITDTQNNEVELTVTPLQQDTTYVINAWEIQTESGMVSDTVQTTFQYVSGVSALVDNEDNLFIVQSGDWTSHNDSKSINGTYLTTPAGDGTNRVYWRYPVPQSGFYDVTVFFPDSSQFVSDAMYLLKTDAGFDTIRVNQQIERPNGLYLGQVWADVGENLVVKLHNESSEGSDYLVAADAVKFEKSFYTQISTEKTGLPTETSLEQNYPNPFNPETTFKFSLKTKSQITLNIYDLTGRNVKTVFQGFQTAGAHSVHINMNDLPSGIYFYQLQTSAQVLTRKMTLLK